MLHALQEVLVVGDVQQQGQLRGIGFSRFKRGVEQAIVGAVVADGGQAGLLRQVCGGMQRAPKPALALRAADAQRDIALLAQLVGDVRCVATTQQCLTHAEQFSFEQLLVELDEVALAGPIENDPGDQRNHGGTACKQQCQPAAQGQSAHQSARSSRT